MSEFLRELEIEKQQLNDQIGVLKKQIEVIDKLIIKKTAELNGAISGETVNKKNIERIFNETLILEIIRRSKHGLRTGEIVKRARIGGKALNANSVRTYITRMRDKGLIYKKANYNWVIKEVKSIPANSKDIV